MRLAIPVLCTLAVLVFLVLTASADAIGPN
jgi:hypothetical protein